jgi:hypothetical protein
MKCALYPPKMTSRDIQIPSPINMAKHGMRRISLVFILFYGTRTLNILIKTKSNVKYSILYFIHILLFNVNSTFSFQQYS